MMRKSVALAAAAWCLIALKVAPSAQAQSAVPDVPGGRYLFSKQADGFVRLDTQTGEVALCSQKTVGMACEAAPEDRAVLESEIARLRGENAALKKEILSRGLPLPPGSVAEPSVAQSGEPSNDGSAKGVPSDPRVDRLVAFMGRIWHRFVGAVERAQQQVFHKS